MHWARLEASALGSLCCLPRMEETKEDTLKKTCTKMDDVLKTCTKIGRTENDVPNQTYPSKLHCNMELILANTELKTDNWTCLVFTTDLCWFSLAILHVISFWSFLSSCLVTSTSAHSVQYLILCTVNIPAHNHSTHKVSVNDSDRSAIYHNTVANL